MFKTLIITTYMLSTIIVAVAIGWSIDGLVHWVFGF